MKKYFELLARCPLFEDIRTDEIGAMLGCLDAKVKHFSKGETIFAEEDEATHIGIMLSGEAQIVRTDYHGNRSIISSLEPPELFGEAFACAEVKSLPISVAAARDCDIMLINCRCITRTCQNACDFHGKMIFNLLKIVARKNIQINQRAEIISKRTTRAKLMSYLTFMKKQHGSNYFTIPFDRQELADYLEVDRSGLSAEIGKLRDEGVLESHRSTFKQL